MLINDVEMNEWYAELICAAVIGYENVELQEHDGGRSDLDDGDDDDDDDDKDPKRLMTRTAISKSTQL